MNERSTLGLVVSLVVSSLAPLACGTDGVLSPGVSSDGHDGASTCTDACGCMDGGGCGMCTVDADCPRSPNPCVESRCEEGACALFMVTEGSRVPGLQIDGDCRVVVCLGGQVTSRPDVDDPEDDQNDCTRDYCDGDGGMHHVYMPDGMKCDHDKGLCKSGVCRLVLGSSCLDPVDCASGFCSMNVCCESACGGTCFACDQPGAAGACLPVPPGSRHAGCPGLSVCVAPKDGCSSLAANGSPCNAAWDCASQACKNGVCGQADGTACAADSDCCSAVCQSNECALGGAACDGEAATN